MTYASEVFRVQVQGKVQRKTTLAGGNPSTRPQNGLADAQAMQPIWAGPFRLFRGHGLQLSYPSSWSVFERSNGDGFVLDAKAAIFDFRIAPTTQFGYEERELRLAAIYEGWTLDPQTVSGVVTGSRRRDRLVLHAHLVRGNGRLYRIKAVSQAGSMAVIRTLKNALERTIVFDPKTVVPVQSRLPQSAYEVRLSASKTVL